jgi:hypothetical protein
MVMQKYCLQKYRIEELIRRCTIKQQIVAVAIIVCLLQHALKQINSNNERLNPYKRRRESNTHLTVTSPGLTFVLPGLIFKFLRMDYETRII